MKRWDCVIDSSKNSVSVWCCHDWQPKQIWQNISIWQPDNLTLLGQSANYNLKIWVTVSNYQTIVRFPPVIMTQLTNISSFYQISGSDVIVQLPLHFYSFSFMDLCFYVVGDLVEMRRTVRDNSCVRRNYYVVTTLNYGIAPSWESQRPTLQYRTGRTLPRKLHKSVDLGSNWESLVHLS